MDYDNDMYSIKTAQATPEVEVETGAEEVKAEKPAKKAPAKKAKKADAE